MGTLKLYILVLFTALNPSFCFAYKVKYPIDSIDAITKERVQVIRHYVGAREHRKSGQAFMEQKGNKYSITLPYYDFATAQSYSYPIEPIPGGGCELTQKKLSDEFAYETIPKGAKVVMIFDDDEFVESKTEFDNRALFFYGNGSLNKYDQQTTTNWELSWLVKCELTPHDMLLLSQHKIVTAYLVRKGKHIYSPIKHKQSLRIQQSASNLLH